METRNSIDFCSIDEFGEERKPIPKELIDICQKCLQSGKTLQEIQKELFKFADAHPEQIQGTGRRGILNNTMIDFLLCFGSVPEVLRTDPIKCRLDYMNDDEIKNYLIEIEHTLSTLGDDGYAREERNKLEDDKRYLAFMGRIT